MEIVEYKGDVERLRPLCEQWRDEVKKNRLGFSLNETFLLYLQDLRDHNILLVGFVNDEPVAFMGLIVHESPLGDDLILHENMWYIDPAHRGIAGVRMLKAAEKIGRERDCTWFSVTASYLANEEALRVEALYVRMGFSLFESVHIKEL